MIMQICSTLVWLSLVHPFMNLFIISILLQIIQLLERGGKACTNYPQIWIKKKKNILQNQ